MGKKQLFETEKDLVKGLGAIKKGLKEKPSGNYGIFPHKG